MFPTVGMDDFATLGLLVFLEGVLSIDNALVLALIVSHLPQEQHKRALLYGIFGAVVFRLIAIASASYLMNWTWVKFVGGGYLLYLAAQYFFGGDDEKESKSARQRNFWMTVIVVELTDIAFAIDSILTAVALSQKLWVVMTGGFLGLLLMRFAAGGFIQLLKRFPRFETTAYLLVTIIGTKLILEGFHLPWLNFHSPSGIAFWCFWLSMAATIAFGFSRSEADPQKRL
jgi:YkoY family integral membrane protein